ncbi:MAG TPA: GNAT family N-acetyltransferase [Erysipelothrix sp.]|nr:GNAT family N-acetyltransferase [Erysipelothrix sp.]
MMTLKWENNQDDWIYVRTEVFIKQQGFKNEFDDMDEQSLHLTIYKDQQLVGCARGYVTDDNVALIQRIAVLAPFRRQGFGSTIVLAMEDKLRTFQPVEIRLHAQADKLAFYEQLGYQAIGDQDFDEDVPHQWMKKPVL